MLKFSKFKISDDLKCSIGCSIILSRGETVRKGKKEISYTCISFATGISLASSWSKLV